jgi:ferredoxin-thioredoxin reductase catalytic subunit
MKKKVVDDARDHGYFLNPDKGFLKNLVDGLLINEERYRYPSCPCRLSSGNLDFDRDIICPCDYRDQDIEEYGYCYCALFVNKNIFDGNTTVKPIPERRPLEKQIRGDLKNQKTTKLLKPVKTIKKNKGKKILLTFYYCKQCGYLCYREEPPYKCPICKAKKEMFAVIPIHNQFIS